MPFASVVILGLAARPAGLRRELAMLARAA
jgi:hypothetical protein